MGKALNYEAEYTIEKEKWVILRKVAHMSGIHNWTLELVT